MHGSVCIHLKSGRQRDKIKFWNDVAECLRKIGRGRRVVLIGDMNERIGISEMEGVVGKWGVGGINKNGVHMFRKGTVFGEHLLAGDNLQVYVQER